MALTNYEQFCIYSSQSTQDVKAPLPKQRLAILNTLVDDFVGSASKAILNGKVVMKYSTTFLGVSDIFHGKRLNFQQYGHIVVDSNKFIRVSTCLNKERRLVQVPVSEKQYWNDSTYLFFTTGDLFLMCKTSDLEKCHSYVTDLNNYEYTIPDLFMSNAVLDYGIVKNNVIMNSGLNCKFTDLSSVSLPKRFKTFKIKGCTASFRPKYALQEVTGFCRTEYYTTIEGIFKQHGEEITYTPQYINKIAKKNAETLLDEYTYNHDKEDDFRHKTKTITLEDGKEYMIVSLKDNGSSGTLNEETFDEITKECSHRIDVKNHNDYERLDRDISIEEAMNYLADLAPDNVVIVRSILRDDAIRIKNDALGKISYNLCLHASLMNQVKYGYKIRV